MFRLQPKNNIPTKKTYQHRADMTQQTFPTFMLQWRDSGSCATLCFASCSHEERSCCYPQTSAALGLKHLHSQKNSTGAASSKHQPSALFPLSRVSDHRSCFWSLLILRGITATLVQQLVYLCLLVTCNTHHYL